MKQRNVVGCTVQYILVESCSFPIQIRSRGEAAFEIMFPNTRTLVDLCSKDEIKCDTCLNTTVIVGYSYFPYIGVCCIYRYLIHKCRRNSYGLLHN